MSVFRFSVIRAHLGEPDQRRRASWLACLVIIAAVLTGTAAAHAEGLKPVCSAATEETVQCMSFEISGTVSFEGSGEKGGLDPADLRSAYKLPEAGGSGQTVAIVDAYNDPNAESDLKKYREKYKLAECTESNKCFKKINQTGEAKNYPASSASWTVEMSLDLDMVSAVCSECHILLVEATSNTYSNMETAENEAAKWEEAETKKKATEISNSWGGPERSGETSENSAFEHAGIPITVAAGDYCYINECEGYTVPNFPAVSPSVIAVGGTELTKASNSRGWSESVWYEPKSEYGEIGTGSGCSLYESKPSWETGSSCSKRTGNDVSAVGACKSPLSIYDSYEREGWFVECGTSAATPIVAGVEALSTGGARKDGAELFWKLGTKDKLFDVTEGHNYSVGDGSCGSYLCEAEVGYDGPTGNGTPDGALATEPSATTEAAIEISKTAAELEGSVNPEGMETNYYFQYGTSETYGSTTAEASAGSGTSNVKVGKAITHLTAGTKYDFRIVATNSNKETSYGGNQAFTTLPNAPEDTTLPVASPTTPDQAVPESSTTGTWTNEPTGFTYQWELCNATGGECTNITGATSAAFTPTEADVGHTLVVKVTASNKGGSSSAASAATNKVEPVGKITEYSVSHIPESITAGPDGNLWFTELIANKVGKMTTSGTVTEYALPEKSEPLGIVAGPDGNLWFTDSGTGKIGKITTTGTVTEYSLPTGSEPYGITPGPSKENDLWFTDRGTGKVGKISTSGTVTEYSLPEKSTPWGIAVGPDDNLWFADWTGSKVGKVTTAGSITEYSTPKSEPKYITAGPDGNLWFTYSLEAKVGKITTSGTATEYALPEKSYPEGIATGADGNLWVADENSSKLSRVTTSGAITEYSLPAKSEPYGIASGPDDNLWFTETGTLKIGKITP